MSELLYTFRTPYPAMYQAGRDNVASMEVYRDGAIAAPSAARFTLLDPVGVAVVDDAEATVGVDGIARFTLLGASHLVATRPLGEGWQERWQLTLPDGTVRTVDREAALARVLLSPVITDADLESYYPDLPAIRGQATSMQRWIDEAWKVIIGRLIGRGHLPYLVKSGWAFREAHIHLTFEAFFTWCGKSQQRGAYLELAKDHTGKAKDAWSQLSLTTDADHDGRVDDPNRRQAVSTVLNLGGAPLDEMPRDPRW